MVDHIPLGKKIDPSKLNDWIQMHTVTGESPSRGAAFIYVDDLMMGFAGDRFEPSA